MTKIQIFEKNKKKLFLQNKIGRGQWRSEITRRPAATKILAPLGDTKGVKMLVSTRGPTMVVPEGKKFKIIGQEELKLL